jgi:acetylglutamate kinase
VLERLGKKTTFVDGMRVTDAHSMKIVEMVLTGHVNTDVVTRIHKFGGEAIGLSGKDGSLLTAKKLLLEGKDLGMVGTVEQVRTDILYKLLDDGFIPVISPVGVDAHGTTYNVNADSVAAEVAVALQARKIVYLTDVPGIKGADGEVISQTTPDHLAELVIGGVVKGGMRPKVESLLSAIHRGVRSGHIIDGRIRHNLLAELFTSKGVGSWVVAED